MFPIPSLCLVIGQSDEMFCSWKMEDLLYVLGLEIQDVLSGYALHDPFFRNIVFSKCHDHF
jgi:hypothetical protein